MDIKEMLSWIPALLDGAKITIALSIVSVCAGIVIGLFLALGRMSKITVINKMCSAYIFFFRGTPLLMQLYFVYFTLPLINSSFTFSKFLAALLAFSLNGGAYCAEIIRSALQSIDKGQFEAAKVLGMSYQQTMRLVVIPQSVRRLIPPIGNEFIMVLKDVSLVSLIALTDITKVTKSLTSSTASPWPYLPAAVLYLMITAVFTVIFNKLEKKFSVYE